MKYQRPLLAGSAIIALFLVVALMLAFTPSVQTWAVRRAMAAEPGVEFSLGRISAGINKVRVERLHWRQDGVDLILPAVEIDLPVIAALRGKVHIKRLVARDWTLDFTAPVGPLAVEIPARQAAAGYLALLAPAGAQTPSDGPRPSGFPGIFSQINLPVDLAVDSADLAGEVIFPTTPGHPPGRAHANLTGGNLGPGLEGRFVLTTDVVTADASAPVNHLTSRSELIARMESPRAFNHLEIASISTASGPQIPNGARLNINLGATRDSLGENYTLSLRTAVKMLADIRGSLPAGATDLGGTWQVDARSADITPFTLGRILPTFSALGGGSFVLDRAFSEIQLTGRLDASAERLEVIMPELLTIGMIGISADFDVFAEAHEFRISRLQAELIGAAPVASVEVLQGLEFNRLSGELRVADPAEDLVQISLHGLPLGWVQPFVPDLTLTGDAVRGGFMAQARGGRFSIYSTLPVEATALSISRAGRPLVRDLDLAVAVSGDYTPRGWQAEVSSLTLYSAGRFLLALNAKAGQAQGWDQPIKATGQYEADIPGLLAQPAGAEYDFFTSGHSRGEFTVSIDDRTELATAIGITSLRAGEVELPDLKIDLRTDLHPDGRLDARIPIIATKEGRSSDLTLAAALRPVPDNGYAITAQLASQLLYWEDLQLLAALVPAGEAAVHGDPTPLPVWAGLNGELGLQLSRVVYSPLVTVNDVIGTVRIGPSAVTIDNLSAMVSEGGSVRMQGDLAFNPLIRQAYALKAELALTDFDPAPLFRAGDPRAVPPVEGRFNVLSRMAGQGADLGALFGTATGVLTLNSRGGTLRALSVDISEHARTGSRLAGVAGIIGLATGDTRTLRYADRLRAASELTLELSALAFDQLTMQVERADDGSYFIKDLSVISPTMRLLGAGSIRYDEALSLWDQPLSLQLQLGARDRLADHLRTLHLLGEQTDPLGYAPLVERLILDGSLSAIGTSQLKNLLVKALNGL